MPGPTHAPRRLVARLRDAWRHVWQDRRGTIALIVAVSAIPLSIASGVAVDMSRMASSRSVLQRAVDNAALSGAAAYVVYTQSDAFNAKAQTTARVVFCKAVATLPGGFALVASNATACTSTPGATVSAVIAGFVPGTRGTKALSGCTASNTVVTGVTCGFVVTVSTTASVRSIFPFISGGTLTVSVSASAINPFINLAVALKPNFNGAAANGNSLWVYPLLLDSNGAPDFSVSSGALPDTSACSGNPTQISCGSYTMLASTLYLGCPGNPPAGGCNVGNTSFIKGIVQNPVVGTAVITATTPLGIAFQSAAGAGSGSPYYYGTTKPSHTIADQNCVWPSTAVYNTVAQSFDANGYPLLIDSNGNWPLVTHWFYSSFLANNQSPDYNELALQRNGGYNPATGYPYSTQVIPAVQNNYVSYNPAASSVTPVPCPSPTSVQNAETMTTTYPASGNTNCALYIVKDPASLSPNPSYVNNNTCFSPANTPGYQYAALSCQNYAGHNFAFFWNDMSGNAAYGNDDTDYGNGTLQVSCSGSSYVLLIS